MPLGQHLSRVSRVTVRHRRATCVATTRVFRRGLTSHEEYNDEYKKRHKVRSSCIMAMLSPRKLYNNPFTICIEGNIGSGKTTFLDHFQSFNNATILQEPMDLWRNVAGVNLLELFYKDSVNYAFLFQSYVQLTRLQLHTMATPSPYKVMERSVFSGRCFLENMKRTHMIQDVEAMVLENWYDWCMENTNIRTDLIIYLRTTPEVVFQRMQARARKEEDCVSLEYLRQIHEIHDDWLYKKTLFSLPAPVMILDGDKSLEEMVPQFEKCKDRILNEQTDGTTNARIVLNTKA
ncbi:deoxynucleoside kinase-like isoform X1 [Temnothorax curvispinosus]|uniref:Deoxynucleoside kinase-like isoform X1 n=2 Tax=Temnothorax curvispinosus TaxID=300111 RepID=A0A6J1PNS9_9HYME|nr:deoxynucleoside kinase-like isoform X1 [Temnothorax curvispinosus]